MIVEIKHKGTFRELVEKLCSTFTKEALDSLSVDLMGKVSVDSLAPSADPKVAFARECFLEHGVKIPVIRALREKYNWPLKEAKSWLEEHWAEISGESSVAQ